LPWAITSDKQLQEPNIYEKSIFPDNRPPQIGNNDINWPQRDIGLPILMLVGLFLEQLAPWGGFRDFYHSKTNGSSFRS
jgi:hypothetical protein